MIKRGTPPLLTKMWHDHNSRWYPDEYLLAWKAAARRPPQVTRELTVRTVKEDHREPRMEKSAEAEIDSQGPRFKPTNRPMEEVSPR